MTDHDRHDPTLLLEDMMDSSRHDQTERDTGQDTGDVSAMDSAEVRDDGDYGDEARATEQVDPVVASVLTATAGQLLLTPAEAAGVLRVSRSKVYELMRRGDVLSVRLGGCRRVPREALVAYVEQLAAAAVLAEQERRRGWSHEWRAYAPGLTA